MRVIQFSDIHISAKVPWYLPGTLLSKQVTGLLNYSFRRKHRFRYAIPIVQQLVKRILNDPPDLVLFTGDAVVVGATPEFQAAMELLKPLTDSAIPKIAVPGNHDFYRFENAHVRQFETAFSKWFVGERVGEAIFPFAQYHQGIWFVAANSARPNHLAWDSRGQFANSGRDLLPLSKLLTNERKVLVTHYPAALADGTPEPYWRRLRPAPLVYQWIAENQVDMWVHGHQHRPFIRQPSEKLPFLQVCNGSTTQEFLWAYHEYLFEEDRVLINRYQWDVENADFHQSTSMTHDFPAPTTQYPIINKGA